MDGWRTHRALAVVLRLARAAVFAAVCVLLSSGGHELAGGHRVGLGALGLAWLVVFTVAWAGARRERSLGVITAALAVGQLGLHLWFTSAGQPPGPTRAMARMTMASMPGAGSGGHCLPSMLGAHLGAAVIAGVWLRRGEAGCWRLLRRAGVLARAAVRSMLSPLGGRYGPAPGSDRPGRVRPRHVWVGMVAALLAYSAPRRGPPRPSAPMSGLILAY